ncbi:MAG: hypothetical protein H6591_13915 [Flavobacteriales bacterium]|nr:hypothetical protein [Flavobacteriales bacterium]
MEPKERHEDPVLLDEDFLRMTYAADHQLIHLQWRGHARSDQYRHGLNVALEFVRKNGVRCWLADLRLMTAIMKEDEEWANTVWFPQLFGTGLEKMAILPSKDYFNQTSVTRSFTAVNGQLTFKVAWFESPSEALVWLFAQEAISA